MQTLELSGGSKRSDGVPKSIFRPSVENAWDVDYLGRQGFWICLIIAAFHIPEFAANDDEFHAFRFDAPTRPTYNPCSSC